MLSSYHWTPFTFCRQVLFNLSHGRIASKVETKRVSFVACACLYVQPSLVVPYTVSRESPVYISVCAKYTHTLNEEYTRFVR